MKENIKQRLNDVRESSKEKRSIMWGIQNLVDKIDTIRDANQRIMGHDSHIKGSEISDPTGDKAAKIVDEYHEEYEALCVRLDALNEETRRMKSELENMREKKVLKQNEFDVINLFYFEGLSLEEISDAMYYSLDWVQELKGKAVRKWGKVYHA